MNTLRPLILVLPLCGLVVAVAALLEGTWAYIVGCGVIAAFLLLALPLVLSKPHWRAHDEN